MSDLISVHLEGGPADLPPERRIQYITGEQDKVKVRHNGGHEHFERTEEHRPDEHGPVLIYRWTTRTRIAE